MNSDYSEMKLLIGIRSFVVLDSSFAEAIGKLAAVNPSRVTPAQGQAWKQ
jgi:hypothetical protein